MQYLGDLSILCMLGKLSALYLIKISITVQSGPLVFTICMRNLLSMGEKKNSEFGLVLDHLYMGTGLPELDKQVSVTLALTSGFPSSLQMGVAGGTARYQETNDNIKIKTEFEH